MQCTRGMANKSFKRTPNTARPAANAFGILSQQSAPYSVPLNWALDGFRRRILLLVENEGSGSRGSLGFVVPRMPATVRSKRPYSLFVWPSQQKALTVMWRASGTEEGCSSGAIELEGSFAELRSLQIQLS